MLHDYILEVTYITCSRSCIVSFDLKVCSPVGIFLRSTLHKQLVNPVLYNMFMLHTLQVTWDKISIVCSITLHISQILFEIA